MLKHTKKVVEIYEDIQRKLYYMIPEKWDELYLYASVVEKANATASGELYFYYIPKGILRKKPISVYEIPAKFNLEESEYLKLVDVLYSKFKELKNIYKQIEADNNTWTNLTLTIKNTNFKVEYDYEDLSNSDYNSYERHILWRYYVLGISLEQCTREEREIIKRYETGVKIMSRKEKYETGIYIKNIKNIVDYTTQTYENTKEIEEVEETNEDKEVEKTEEPAKEHKKNQILMGQNKTTKETKKPQEELTKEKEEEIIEKPKKQSKYIIE